MRASGSRPPDDPLRPVRPAVLTIGRTAGIVVLAVAAGVGAAALVVRFAPDSLLAHLLVPASQPLASGPPPTALPTVAIGGPFDLVGPDGRAVRDTSFPGRWKLIYFGYTSCPDICPTTMQVIAGALDLLGARASLIAPLFITVDPARDRPDTMARYTALFDRRIIGLTGSQTQVDRVKTNYRVYATVVHQPGGDGLSVDHTSFIYLMAPDGTLHGLFDRNATAASLAAGIARALGSTL